MKKYLFIPLFLICCCAKKEEDSINSFISENDVELVNLSAQKIAPEQVLNHFEEDFLKKYSFYPNYIKKNIDIGEIVSKKGIGNRYSQLSEPIFSMDGRYCLIQIVQYENNGEVANEDIIYLLEKKDKVWVVVYEMEKMLFH